MVTAGRSVTHRAAIEADLQAGRRLSRIRTLLGRQDVAVSDATLRRFAIAELGFGRATPTVPVADGDPGEEVQLDTGWMTHLPATDLNNPALGRSSGTHRLRRRDGRRRRRWLMNRQARRDRPMDRRRHT